MLKEQPHLALIFENDLRDKVNILEVETPEHWLNLNFSV